MRFNAYNTEDPQQLLHLKRQEAQAMLEVVRSMTPGIEAEELIFVVVNTIRRQLGVYKLMLVISDEQRRGKEVEVNYGFGWADTRTLEELTHIRVSTALTADLFPALAELGAEYAIPLGAEGFMHAWLLIADFAESPEEEQNDIVFIETIGNILVLSLQNIRLFEEKLAKERIQRELEVAGSIQRQSLPDRFDVHPGLDIDALSISHSSVGGDFYNILQTDPNTVHVFIADAAGKGVAAALLITNIQAYLNALIRTGAGYGTIIDQLHAVIGRLTKFEAFVTLFLLRIDLDKRTITYLNAGHNPPLLLRNQHVEELREGSIPLGIMAVEEFEIGERPFEPGDMVLMYTDGVVEQPDLTDNLFGEHRVEEVLRQNAHETAALVVENLYNAVSDYAGDVPFQDDLTLVAVRAV